jgi:hypothetical protein
MKTHVGPASGLRLFIAVALAACIAYGDDVSTGVDGIHARGLRAPDGGTLTGAGIAIGQVEPNRPGKPGFDDPAFSHPKVEPKSVFVQQNDAGKNAFTSDHAEMVAGVMIAQDSSFPGVAPGASLYAGADAASGPFYDPESAITAQHIALQNGGDVRAINMSFGNPLLAGTPHDGSALLSQFVDWSADVHDTLYVTAGDESGVIIPASPQDSFNHVNVGFTRKDAEGVYRLMDSRNVTTVTADGRRINDLVAPGTGLTMPRRGGTEVPPPAWDGTSFAAPHVTGSVALLQEYGEEKIESGVPHWDEDARRHEVTKAVLMNSADKVEDEGDGKRLGMEKTILDTRGNDWLASDAYTSKSIPLDDELGTGQINTHRAWREFSAGEWDSFGSAEVPLIGWDYGVTLGAGDFNRYIFNKPLVAESFVSITLAWDREIALEELGQPNGSYDIGESFETLGLTDLDLYLMPRGAEELSDHVWASFSLNYSVEHVFFEIVEAGDYEFWVYQADEPLADQWYAVAWEAVPEPSSLIAGILLASGAFGLQRRRRRRPDPPIRPAN